MNPNLFAVAQGRVAETIERSDVLSAKPGSGALSRTAKMVIAGALAATALATFSNDASAQQQNVDPYLARQVGEAVRQTVGQSSSNWQGANELSNLINMGVHAANAPQVTPGMSSAIGSVAGAALTRLINPKAKPATYAVAAAAGAGAGYVYSQMRTPQGAVVQQQQGYGPTTGPAFFSPADLGLPLRFTQVSQRIRVGVVRPGQFPLDLRDGSPISQNLTRSIRQLESALDTHAQAQVILNESRFSPVPLQGAQQNQVNNVVNMANQQLDRAVETYIRMSNDAGLQNRDTRPFHQLVTNMVNDRLAPEQQVNMAVNARVNYAPR